jgi:hypothetical protein
MARHYATASSAPTTITDAGRDTVIVLIGSRRL